MSKRRKVHMQAGLASTRLITSEDSPINVSWFPLRSPRLKDNGCALGITMAPGKHGMVLSGGAEAGGYWNRSLPADMKRLREEHCVTMLVSLLENSEYTSLKIVGYTEAAIDAGIMVARLPIPDMNPPRSIEAVDDLAVLVSTALCQGHRVAVHCRGGHGRAGTIAACLLTFVGDYNAQTAIDAVRRGHDLRAVATQGQEDFVYRFNGETCTRVIVPSTPPPRQEDPPLDVRNPRSYNAHFQAKSGRTWDIRIPETFNWSTLKVPYKPSMTDAEWDTYIAQFPREMVK